MRKREPVMPGDLDIVPLTAQRMPDLAVLFARGDPRTCWCAFYRMPGSSWNTSTPELNRAELERAVRRTARQRRAPGLIAYRDGEPVGWVSVGPREDYRRLERSPTLHPVDERPVWSIVCFVVAAKARGRGVATALLDAAVEYARAHGATLVEGYPVDTSTGRISSSSVYKGTLSMFERAGFEVVATRRANRASPVRPIVRREV